MLSGLSHRLLPILQLTRMALVFTAISNSLCSYLIVTRHDFPNDSLWRHLRWQDVLLVSMISVGLYGFGMSLNDIIDRRRDRQLAAHRPIPSGRVGIGTAHAICAALLLLALGASMLYNISDPRNLVLTLFTAGLIAFYDLAGKYLVWPGLLTLGLIRLFHAVIPAPEFPLLWHPLMLFSHVAILSAVAYQWEEKRPPLTRWHWVGVVAGVVAANALAIAFVWKRAGTGDVLDRLSIRPTLALPVLAAAGFVLVGWRIWTQSPNRRTAGQRLMLTGLLWLIVYDSLFAAAYVGATFWTGLPYAAGLLVLLALSWGSVQLMRWWAQLVLVSQPPSFKRLRSDLTPGSER
jgi:hypothetical protein